MSEPNPKGDLVWCLICRKRATFTRDAICSECRPLRRLPPTKVPEVNR